jgi:hypothetical protein
MIRRRFLILVGLCSVFGTGALLTVSSRADPITVIDGAYKTVTPTGSGIGDVGFTNGFWTISGMPNSMLAPLSDLEIKSGRAFPQIGLQDPATGLPTITLMVAGDPAQRAIFDLPAVGAGWGDRGGRSFVADVLLETNSIRGADLSPFANGGTLTFSTEGITVDPMTNLVTISEGATASFELRAVPEPATAVLGMLGGAIGLVWLWRTRRRSAVQASLGA